MMGEGYVKIIQEIVPLFKDFSVSHAIDDMLNFRSQEACLKCADI